MPNAVWLSPALTPPIVSAARMPNELVTSSPAPMSKFSLRSVPAPLAITRAHIDRRRGETNGVSASGRCCPRAESGVRQRLRPECGRTAGAEGAVEPAGDEQSIGVCAFAVHEAVAQPAPARNNSCCVGVATPTSKIHHASGRTLRATARPHSCRSRRRRRRER